MPGPQEAAREQRPNRIPIIVISVDTLRPDHLGCYGARSPATVHIDQFAAGGTVFSQVNAQVPLTLPSHVSLFTSTYPFANGIEDNGQRLPPNAVTLARVLRSKGYRTAAFVGGFVLDRRFGLDQGFDVYDGPSTPRAQAGKDPGDIKRLGETVTYAAEQWLDQNATHPFFLFVHLYDLHTPYKLPPSESSRGLSYDSELAYVDDILGKFWNFLDRRGLARRAIMVFTSDHGESLHEHGESTHGYFVYQSTLRVPLILHWPSQLPSFASRIDTPVSLLDVAPTLLQITGFATPDEFQGQNLQGLLVKPGATTAKNDALEEIYGESLYAHAHFGTSALRTLRIGSHKYVQAPNPEFYDLVQDSKEEHNLYESQKLLANTFRARLEALQTRYHAQRTSATAGPSPEAIDRLRSLGYLGGGEYHTSSADSGVDPKNRIADYEAYGRAIALGDAGHLSASNTALEQLLNKEPGLLEVRMSLGLNQQKLDRYVEAAENFKAVLKQNPANVIAHFNLAVSDHVLGRQRDAVNELEATLALAPYYVRAEEMLASLYLEAKDYESARSHLNHLLESDSGSYAANYNLGVLDCIQGHWEEGERHLRTAIQTDPSSAEAHNTLGSLDLRRNDLEDARAEFGEAIRLNPRFASPHYNLGIVFRQQNRMQEAAREFREALSADPHFRPARDALNRLGLATAGQNE